jgi:hypothetical protein
VAKLVHVVYDDGDDEDVDEAEITALLSAYGADLFKEIVDGLNQAFAYLEARLRKPASTFTAACTRMESASSPSSSTPRLSKRTTSRRRTWPVSK